MNIVADVLERLEVGSPSSFANLTLFPLLGESGCRPDYATLDEAIQEGWFEVSEVSRAGSVPELKAVNRGDRAVFLMDGEELIGTKQNRVLNLTILVPSGKTLVVPVSCVEQGRWSSRSPAMAASGDALYSKARLAKVMSVSRSYTHRRRPMSDQSALWSELAGAAQDLRVSSPTLAMSDMYAKHSRQVGDYERAFTAADGQSGAMFAIGDRLVGLELFEHPETLRKMLRKVVRSYALDAIQAGESSEVPSAKTAREFLTELADGRAETFPAVGLGQDVRITGNRLAGAALVLDDRVVHLCAFRTDTEPHGGRIASASLRRRP
jgi:hypothetical protein